MSDTSENQTPQTPKRVSLFELDIRELELLGAVEDAIANLEANGGEQAQALVDQYLDALIETQAELHTKLAGYVKIITAKKARATVLNAEAQLYYEEYMRLSSQAEQELKGAEFFEGRLKLFMERRGLKELPAGNRTLKVTNQGGTRAVQFLAQLDPNQVPDEFTRMTPPKPSERVLDNTAIAAELKKLADGAALTIQVAGPDGEQKTVEWARLAPRKTVLKIV